jgi:hypothetical protein
MAGDGGPGPHPGGGGVVVYLTVKECVSLGGKVEYWDGCSGGGIYMKCTVGDRAVCITE